jgi:hypothetical protein
LLEAHPSLACPPESGIVELSARMGNVTQTLDGRSDLSELAASSIRSWLATTFTTYLLSTGKTRWCEKSLGSADAAQNLLRLFPMARFICLYRNCMDVIDSLHEACPWGLRGYGLDPFAASHPGNTVAAAADYWVCQTRELAAFEQAHPDRCARLRYEDLAAAPEAQAERIFAFLDEKKLPAVTAASFTGSGPGSGSVLADPVGRGSRVPTAAIPPPIIALINELHVRLGYAPLDRWNADPAVTVLELQEARQPGDRAGHAAADSALDELEDLLVPRLIRGLPEAGLVRDHAAWPGASVSIAAAVRAHGAAFSRWWEVDLDAASVSRVDQPEAHQAGAGQPAGSWGVVGDAPAWTSVLSGQLSVATALRHGHLRLSGPPAPDTPQWMGADPRVPVLMCLVSAGRQDQ